MESSSEAHQPLLNCFAGPPSAPRNVISNINETSVILDWSWPLDTGGRKDVTFNVICRKCGWNVQQCEPCSPNVRFLPRQFGLANTTVTVTDLLAHTNYTFEIDATNGVSELSSPPRQFAPVSITTNQAGESTWAPARADSSRGALPTRGVEGRAGKIAGKGPSIFFSDPFRQRGYLE